MATRPCNSCSSPVEQVVVMGIEIPILLCDTCGDAKRKLDEAEWRDQQRRRLLDRAGATRMLEAWDIATYPDDTEGKRVHGLVKAWLIDYRAGDAKNLILFGGVGAGKTGLAWSVIRFLIDERVTRCEYPDQPGLPGMLVNWRTFLEQARHAIRHSDPHPDYERTRFVPVLVLDDLGAERPTDFAREELANLVEHRTANLMPTVVTSNYTPDQLVKRLGHDDPIVGQRIVSRLCQGATQIRFTSPDRRKEVAAA